MCFWRCDLEPGENEYHAICRDRTQAHAAAREAYEHAQRLLELGENVLIVCKPAAEPIGIRQRRFLHGVVLKTISEQARINGERFVVAAWKEFYRNLLLTPRWEMQKLPGEKKAHPVRKRASTEELGIRAYGDFIDGVVSHAVTELNVEFHFGAEERALMRRSQQHTDEGDKPDEPV